MGFSAVIRSGRPGEQAAEESALTLLLGGRSHSPQRLSSRFKSNWSHEMVCWEGTAFSRAASRRQQCGLLAPVVSARGRTESEVYDYPTRTDDVQVKFSMRLSSSTFLALTLLACVALFPTGSLAEKPHLMKK